MLLVIFYYTYLFSVWSAYRFFTNFSEPVDEIIFKPFLWIVPILLVVVWYEKRSITKSLGYVFSSIQRDIVFGMITAIGLYSTIIIAVYIKFGDVLFNPFHLSALAIPVFLFSSLSTAIVEETAFRGFILTRLAKLFRDRRLANVMTTALFLIVHLPIYAFTHIFTPGQILSAMFLSAAISLVDGYLFYHRRGIIAPIAAHTTWNILATMVR